MKKKIKTKGKPKPKYELFKLSQHIDIPMSNGKFRVLTKKEYITRRQWFDAKGRLYIKCIVYNVFRKGKKIWTTKDKWSKEPIIVSAEYPHITKHKKKVLKLCYNRASYEHIRRGGKSDGIIEVLDWIIKYPTFYNPKSKVSYFRFKQGTLKSGDTNKVYKNVLYNKGKARFKTFSESDYLKPDVFQDLSIDAFQDFESDRIEPRFT